MRIPAAWRGGLLALSVACVLAGSALMIRNHLADNGTFQERFAALTSQLRAPGDENTMPVASSSSQMAQHIKYEIQQQLLAGKTNAEIIEEMVREYGPDVYAAPPMQGFGAAAWLVPILFVAGSVFAAMRFLSERSAAESLPQGDGSDTVLNPASSDLPDSKIRTRQGPAGATAGDATAPDVSDFDVKARLRDWL
jgi:cytochrome c-type biogenesis protein CcmH